MREESLRRILVSAGGARLTEDQKREILTHLQDSVDAKLKTGMPEIEAVSRAFEEMGDLNRMAADFPPPAPAAAVTPEGALAGYMPAINCYLMLFGLAVIVAVLNARFSVFFRGFSVEMPAAYTVFASLGSAVATYWPVTIGIFVLLGFLIARFGNRRGVREAMPVISVGLGLIFVAALFSMVLPFASLMQGIGAGR